MSGSGRNWCAAGVLLVAVSSTPALARAGGSDDATADAGVPGAVAVGEPWRAHEALGLSWLAFGLEQRTRFEHLANDFRPQASGDSTAAVMRTLLAVALRFEPLTVGLELQDSRAFATSGTPLNTTLVNPFELLQAYVRLGRDDLLVPGDSAALTVGRLTMDFGSRRLLARNDYRNTINGFTGADLSWRSPAGHVLRGFAVMPVIRLPAEEPGLGQNATVFDRENTSALLWGALFGSAPLAAGVQLEGYVLGLHEWDSPLAPSSDRRLITTGLRVMRAPATGQLDFQLEVMVQVGTSRRGASAGDVTDLAHRASAAHLTAGHRFGLPGSPRLAVQYDYASGDADPADGVNGRFDPLFGARRFDFGPTSLFGALARSNLHSPGLRLEVSPHRTLDAMISYRASWLASARDAWTTAPLVDPSGASGAFIGHLVEGRVRFSPFPRNVALELGAAYLARGRFVTASPGARPSDPIYVYAQLTGAL